MNKDTKKLKAELPAENKEPQMDAVKKAKKKVLKKKVVAKKKAPAKKVDAELH